MKVPGENLLSQVEIVPVQYCRDMRCGCWPDFWVVVLIYSSGI